MQDLDIREKNNTLKLLKNVIDNSMLEPQFSKFKSTKTIDSLRKKFSQIKTQKLKSLFFYKLNKNNIFSQPYEEEVLSKKQKNKKRFIKWKGYRLKYHRPILSILYLIQMFLLIVTFIYSSLMGFLEHFLLNEAHNSFSLKVAMLTTMIFCVVMMVVNSTLQKVKKGIFYQYISEIFNDYVKSWIFFVDLIYFCIVFVLYFTILEDGTQETIRKLSIWLFIWSVVRIITSNQNMALFKTAFLDSFKKDQYFKLIKLLIFNILFAHFIACIFLAMTMIDQTKNWMVSKNLQHQIWYIGYMWSFYWATTMMTTVGFGDYVATTHYEAYVVAFLQLFSCMVLAYNISQIGSIISALRSSQQDYTAKVATFKRMAQQNQTNHELKIKIESYLREEREIKEKFEFNQQNELLNCLPQPLRKEFILESNGRIFRSLPFFKNLQKNTLVLLAEAFTNRVFYPGEILIRAHQYNDSIMILKEGKVGLVYRKYHSQLNGIVVEEIQKQKVETVTKQGEKVMEDLPILLTVEFLSPGKTVSYDMNATTYSYVSEVKHNDFLEVIKKNDVDAEFYFGILHVKGSQEKEWSQLLCHRCSENLPTSNLQQGSNSLVQSKDPMKERLLFHHNKFECPKLHYFPWKALIMQKYIQTDGKLQKRMQIFNRKKRRQFSCLSFRSTIYKNYQSKRFIKQKKNFNKVLKDSIAKLEKKQSRKIKQGMAYSSKFGQSIFSNLKKNMSQKKSTIDQRQNKQTDLNLKKTYQAVLQKEWQQFLFEQEEQKTLIETVIKKTMDEIIPKNISQDYWDLQIDCMANYQNYFPNDNAARIDYMTLNRKVDCHKERKRFINTSQLKNPRYHSLSKLQHNSNHCDKSIKIPSYQSKQNCNLFYTFQGSVKQKKINQIKKFKQHKIKNEEKNHFQKLSNKKWTLRLIQKKQKTIIYEYKFQKLTEKYQNFSTHYGCC